MDRPKKNLPLREKLLREKLAIPPSAEKVIVFGETSHWDPNWLFTTEEYFNISISKILDSAIRELEREAGRVYSVECVFFLKMYWDKRPEKRNDIRRLVNQGRLRLLGSGMTTPDTTLPETESILRDYLRGNEWLKANGMTQRPRIAYFPDSFGHSPSLPSLLEACSVEYAGITRIDGMGFPGADYRSSSYYPIRGSSAWALIKDFKTLDFKWRSHDGSETLTHWNCFTYFQGDNLVYVGPVKWMGILFGLSRRSGAHLAKRIEEYTRDLAPLSKTPYMFCPIGMDFNPPISGLYALLSEYNRNYYKKTGIYAVIAGLDDYLDLVSCHKDKIPTLELDFNPYWMGFYTSRPKLKKRCKYLAKDLLTAEKLTILAKRLARRKRLQYKMPDLTSLWDKLILTNHHDFITGTSPERVYKKEQKKILEEASEEVSSAMGSALSILQKPPVSPVTASPKWNFKKGRLSVENGHYLVEMDEREGGAITKWLDKTSGQDMARGLLNDAVSYSDSGGLWRMGHEFRGGKFEISDITSWRPGRISVREMKGLIEVEVRSRLEGKSLTRLTWFRQDSPVVRFKLIGTPRIGNTVTARFSTSLDSDSLVMDVPGGVVTRQALKIFDPTFWAAKSFVHYRDRSTGRGMAVALFAPACVSAIFRGILEMVAIRNTPKETAYGILPIMAHPVKGYEPGDQSLIYAVWPTQKGDYRHNRLWHPAERVLRASWLAPTGPDVDKLVDSVVTADSKDVYIGAVKIAESGAGFIVRILSYLEKEKSVRLAFLGAKVKKGFLCDALENDLAELKTHSGKLEVPLKRHITTVRMILD